LQLLLLSRFPIPQKGVRCGHFFLTLLDWRLIPEPENGLSCYFKTIGHKAAIVVAALTVRGPITRVAVFGLLYGMNEVELIHLARRYAKSLRRKLKNLLFGITVRGIMRAFAMMPN
jgi:hypothetical protein